MVVLFCGDVGGVRRSPGSDGWDNTVGAVTLKTFDHKPEPRSSPSSILIQRSSVTALRTGVRGSCWENELLGLRIGGVDGGLITPLCPSCGDDLTGIVVDRATCPGSIGTECDVALA